MLPQLSELNLRRKISLKPPIPTYDKLLPRNSAAFGILANPIHRDYPDNNTSWRHFAPDQLSSKVDD